MKKFILNATALASFALFSGVALATVDLDDTATLSTKFASEQTITTTLALVHNAAAADLRATALTGATLPLNAAGYMRFDLSSGTFTANPSLAVTDSLGAATATVAQGGAGQSFVIFSVTPGVGASLITAGAVTLTPGSITVANKNAVSLTYKLFETLTGAANQVGALKTASQGYIAFQNAVTTTLTAGSKVADVAVTPAYTAFTSATTPLGTVVIANVANTNIAAGTVANASTTIATGVPTVDGDFTSFVNDNGTYTGAALNRVFLSTSSTCASVDLPSTALTATTATFASITGANLAGTRYLCVTAEGTPAITTAAYTISIDYTGVTGFVTADVVTAAIGSITRNGTNLVAPLAQVPGGWFSRLVLVNSGTAARTYTVRAVSETGNTVTLSGAAASGTLAANSTTVIDLPASLTYTTTPRASLLVTVNGPSSAIDGLYQLTNPATGAVTNHTLIVK